MSATTLILEHLHNVRQVKAGSWMAGCPCCVSRKGRPLAITEAQDGRVLLHAFCGCTTDAVLGAVGLELCNLFERPLAHAAQPARSKIPAADVLDSLSHEALVLSILASDLLTNKQLTEDDWTRLATAAQRIGNASAYLNW